MKGLEFPIIKTKVKGLTKKFDLNDYQERKLYFRAKVGDEIRHIKKFLEKNTFVSYLIGKKNSGKGTYSKLIAEIFGEDKIAHVSVGDLVRMTDDWEGFKKSDNFEKLKSYYRGYISFDEITKSLSNRSTGKLLPTEFILALLKAHMDKLKGKAVFIDGLPRALDQVSFSLYFRDIIDYRDDPDFFVLIDIPEKVLEERMRYRVVCPFCFTSRSTKFLITKKIEYDQKEKKFYLLCDNPNCKGFGKVRMVKKEGDEKGIEAIRERLINDEELIKIVFNLHGVPKILLRNHVPVDKANMYFDDYEITPYYKFKWDSRSKKIKVLEKPWIVKDDNGVESYSLLAAPVVISLIKQMVEVLNL